MLKNLDSNTGSANPQNLQEQLKLNSELDKLFELSRFIKSKQYLDLLKDYPQVARSFMRITEIMVIELFEKNTWDQAFSEKNVEILKTLVSELNQSFQLHFKQEHAVIPMELIDDLANALLL